MWSFQQRFYLGFATKSGWHRFCFVKLSLTLLTCFLQRVVNAVGTLRTFTHHASRTTPVLALNTLQDSLSAEDTVRRVGRSLTPFEHGFKRALLCLANLGSFKLRRGKHCHGHHLYGNALTSLRLEPIHSSFRLTAWSVWASSSCFLGSSCVALRYADCGLNRRRPEGEGTVLHALLFDR